MSKRVRSVVETAAAVISAAVAMAVLAGCSTGTATSALPHGNSDLATTRTPAHTAAGACHQMNWTGFKAVTSPTTEVDCSAPHTSQTVYVGDYPKKLAAKAKGFNATPITTWAVPRCASRVASYLGTDAGTLGSTLFSQTVFLADRDQFARGEHWFRCDVAVAETATRNLLTLPEHVRNILEHGVPRRYVGCVDIKDFAHPPAIPSTVSCAEPQTARPVGLVRLGGAPDSYPPVTVVRERASRGCVAAAHRWIRHTHKTAQSAAYLAPDKQVWDMLGFRDVHCYVVTPN